MEEYLKKIWYDPAHPGSFAEPSKLYQVVKQEGKFNVGMSKIKKFLQNQDAYSLQKKVRRKGFKRRRVVVQGLDYQWKLTYGCSEFVRTQRWHQIPSRDC